MDVTEHLQAKSLIICNGECREVYEFLTTAAHYNQAYTIANDMDFSLFLAQELTVF